MVIEKHFLVPKHFLLSQEDAEKILVKLNVTRKELPLILKNDPAIKRVKPKSGDIIKIIRHSFTAGESIYYRVVK